MITGTHIRAMLRLREQHPMLIISRGRALVVTEEEARSPQHEGALHIAAYEDIAERIGPGTPSDQQINFVAQALNEAVRTLGA